jgi:hypothetical protein
MNRWIYTDRIYIHTDKAERGRHLELDVDDAAEQLGGQIVEAHLVAGDLVHGGLHLKEKKQERTT